MKAHIDRIKPDRMAEDLWKLVNIPSPTGHERAAALAFADMLTAAGATVRIDATLRDSPSVIGRLQGSRPGKTFQLAGHIDHIDVPHAPPARRGNILSGRGSADMKNGLSGILEIVRVLSESGCDFPGEILVTVFGRHEAPVGQSECLLQLIKRGIKGDAALVAESAHSAEGAVVIQGKGQSIWNITITRTGEAGHELNYPTRSPQFMRACLTVAAALMDYGRHLSQTKSRFDLLSPESLFIGQMHYGDFYNRVPTTCRMQGTRRWLPDKRFAQVRQDLDKVLGAVKLPKGISAACDWVFVGESYAVDKTELAVQAQRSAYQAVTGRLPRYKGISVVVDANRLAPLAHVPTVLCGFDCEFAHADHEYVRIDRLRTPCQVTLLTALNYLNAGDRKL